MDSVGHDPPNKQLIQAQTPIENTVQGCLAPLLVKHWSHHIQIIGDPNLSIRFILSDIRLWGGDPSTSSSCVFLHQEREGGGVPPPRERGGSGLRTGESERLEHGAERQLLVDRAKREYWGVATCYIKVATPLSIN